MKENRERKKEIIDKASHPPFQFPFTLLLLFINYNVN
jgi:hypothetical protein